MLVTESYLKAFKIFVAFGSFVALFCFLFLGESTPPRDERLIQHRLTAGVYHVIGLSINQSCFRIAINKKP